MTYGQGLDRDKCISSLFKTIGKCETVLDMSRPGKSNQAIVSDTWTNRNEFDVYLLGFTYSNRFYLEYRDLNIDFHNLTKFSINYQKYFDENIELICNDLHKNLYCLFDEDFFNTQSNILIDTILAKLFSLGKIVIPYSWENRSTDYTIYYPTFGPEFRISRTDNHLNEKGTKKLFDFLQLKLLELTSNAKK